MPEPVSLRSFATSVEAELVRTFLESNGIIAAVEGDTALHAPSMKNGENVLPYELQVAAEDLEAADALLQQSEAGLFAIDDSEPVVNEEAPE